MRMARAMGEGCSAGGFGFGVAWDPADEPRHEQTGHEAEEQGGHSWGSLPSK